MNTPTREPRIRVAALIRESDTLLMVKHQKGDDAYWMLPGGGVDYGETLDEALQRELWEELRVKVSVGGLRFLNDTIAPNGARHIVNVYFDARIEAGQPRLGEDARIVDVAFHPIAALARLTMRPHFAEALVRLLESESSTSDSPKYLGNIWRA